MELATALGAIPVLISLHVRPPSCVRQKCGCMSSMRSVFAAAYAVSVSKWPASMLKIRVQGWIAAGVTFFHVAPPFIVTWMLPSSVPAQRTAPLRGEGDSAVIAPRGVGVTPRAYRPVLAGIAQVCRARSGLMRVQLWA